MSDGELLAQGIYPPDLIAQQCYHFLQEWLLFSARTFFNGIPILNLAALAALFHLSHDLLNPQLFASGLVLLIAYQVIFLVLIGILRHPTGFWTSKFRVFFIKHRYRRSHWYHQPIRRLRQASGQGGFTIFVHGTNSVASVPVRVTPSSTILNVMTRLHCHGLIPSSFVQSLRCRTNNISWNSKDVGWLDTMQDHAMGPLSRLFISARLPGGVGTYDSDMNDVNMDDPGPSKVRTGGRGKRKPEYDATIAAELNDWEESTGRTKKRRRKLKKMAKTASDDETEYEDDAGSDESSEEESNGSDISNGELADSLQSKTMPKSGKRGSRGNQARGDQGKTSKGKQKAAENNVIDVDEEDTPMPSTSQKGKSKTTPAKKLQFIWLFYLDCTSSHADAKPGYKYYQCQLGNKKVVALTPGSNGNLSTLKKHLEKNFPTHYAMYEVLQYRGGEATDEEKKLANGKLPMDATRTAKYRSERARVDGNIVDQLKQMQEIAQDPWDQAHFEQLLARWVAACDQPFTSITEPEFCELLQYVHKHTGNILKIPGHQTIRRRIMDMGQQIEEDLKKLFAKNTSKFAISLDAWTSSNGFAFIAVVVHYINNDGKLEECLINFAELLGEHSGENMAKTIWGTLERYGLKGRIIAFVMDNATNNDTLLDAVEERCVKDGIPFDAKRARMRCMPHTVHLAAIKLLEAIGVISKEDSTKARSRSSNNAYQDVVNSVPDDNAVLANDEVLAYDDPAIAPVSESGEGISLAVDKLRKIVKHVRSSPQRRQKWNRQIQVCIEKLDATLNEVKLILILDVKTRWGSTYQMLGRALDYQEAVDQYVLQDKDLRQSHILSPEDWDAISKVHTWLGKFKSATTSMSTTKEPMLSRLPPSADPKLKTGLVDAHIKLSDYYQKFDHSPYYLWAALLDPRISRTGLQKDYENDPDLLEALENAYDELYCEYKREYAPSETSINAAVTKDGAGEGAKPEDFLARYNETPSANELEAELDQYFALTKKPIPFAKCDLLMWWKGQESLFPHLYKMARDIHCIPGSAVAVERVFSGGRDTIGIRRASLQADTIRTLMLVKARLRVEREQAEELQVKKQSIIVLD